ncbi:macro domain-containing protein [Xanthobacteraceae bacterium Astr-EGSB]|uniref:macro domain-containing protein n=1 Tax=Astrobacterium formosum TaxID=3069710 RepID=UPI0027AFC7E3|nr:macro domain-containing protein [Xanthobacteraceae bacterium Astr-EGSB]
MDITFCDVNPRLAEVAPAALAAVGLVDRVKVVTGDVTRLACDAVVVPADAFGGVGGAADTYRERMPEIAATIVEMVALRPYCELLIGEALAVPTGQRPIAYLVVAPVTRLPAAIGAAESVFIAARAACAEAMKLGVSHLAIPAMGAGVGQLPYETAALAVAAGVAAALGRPAQFPPYHPFHVP